MWGAPWAEPTDQQLGMVTVDNLAGVRVSEQQEIGERTRGRGIVEIGGRAGYRSRTRTSDGILAGR